MMNFTEPVCYNGSNRAAYPSGLEYSGYPFYTHVFSFERDHDFYQINAWMGRNWRVAIYLAAFYLAAVIAIQRYMRDRQPVDVQKSFLCWNVVLAAFSICGTIRSLPEITFVLRNYGFEYSICHNKFNNVSGFWATAFIVSKGVELLETTFLLLRKKLTWLHLIHHVTTLLVSWFLATQKPSLVRWTGCMNYTVHAIMYTYFALKAAKIYVPEGVSFVVTTIQILQFILGTFTSVWAGYITLQGYKCSNTYSSIAILIITNSYFLYLFGKYFINRYFSTKRKCKKL